MNASDTSQIKSVYTAIGGPLGVSADGIHVWATNGGTPVGAVTEVNASDGSVVQTIAVGNNPQAISSDGTHVWVADYRGNTVTELNTSDGSVVQTIAMGSAPAGISSDGTHVWVANSGGTVTELNASDGSVVQTIAVGSTPLAISSDGTHVWVTNTANTVTELNASDGSVVQTIAVGSLPLAISSDGTDVWVANSGSGSNTVTELNASTGSVVDTIGVGSGPSGISSDGTHAWVSNTGGTTVSEIAIPPSTSVVLPSNGATLAATQYLDATASNATSVEFRLFGGIYGYAAPVVCTATPTIYGWLCGWNTTTVPNGSYVLLSEAFSSAGSAFSSGVNITVSNPPTTSVIIPSSNGATLSGTAATLDATASNASSVEFRLFGGIYGYDAPVVCTATPTIYGWLCSWDTTTVPSGSYVLVSEASNSAGSAFSSGVSITVNNPASLVDLTGSFSGTTLLLGGSGGCSFEEQVFDATYPGSSAVGSVALHLDGCVNGTLMQRNFTYTGTFTVTTSVGTLAGNAAGPIVLVPTPDDFELTLSVLSATGAFGGTTGTIHVSILWPSPFGPQMTGSVSVP